MLRLALGFAGVATVLTVTATAADPAGDRHDAGWALVVALAAISWAAGTLWASRSHTAITDPRAAAAVQLVSGGIVLLLVGVLTGETARTTTGIASATSWTAFAYLVLLDSLAGFALYGWLLRSAPVSLVSTYAYAVPVIAYLVGVLVLGEPFRPLVLLGAAAILLAVAAEVRAVRRAL